MERKKRVFKDLEIGDEIFMFMKKFPFFRRYKVKGYLVSSDIKEVRYKVVSEDGIVRSFTLLKRYSRLTYYDFSIVLPEEAPRRFRPLWKRKKQ